MPLYKTITPNSQTTVKIWNITESFEELMEPLTLKPESSNRVLGMKSELHQRGFFRITSYNVCYTKLLRCMSDVARMC